MKNIKLLNICYKFFNRFITVDKLLEELVNMDTSNLSKKDIDEQNKLIEEIKVINKNIQKEIEEYDRWFKIANCINENSYFNKIYESLTDYELLEFIAQYISAPFPPNLTQEEFDRLVNIGIEKDEREWLWRLAFNYEGKSININSIAKYFIDKKDVYYLVELICAVKNNLNIDEIIDMIDDNDLIEELKNRKSDIIRYFSEEQFNRLISKLV